MLIRARHFGVTFGIKKSFIIKALSSLLKNLDFVAIGFTLSGTLLNKVGGSTSAT